MPAKPIDFQQILDSTSELRVRGKHFLQVPLFLDDGCNLLGDDPQAELQAEMAGALVIVGKARGLVDNSHFTDKGFRTKGDTFLFGRGTEWDMGPQPVAGPKGWKQVTRLRVSATVTRYGPDWTGGGVGWPLAIMGCNDRDDPNGMSPKPWCLWIWNGKAMLQYRMADGTRGVVEAPIDTAAETVSISLDTGTLPQPIADNNWCMFGLGRVGMAPNYQGNTGAPLDNWPDIEVSDAKLWINDDVNQLCWQQTGRMPTYPGGKSLPLAVTWTSNGSRFLYAQHKSEMNGPIEPAACDIRDIKLAGGYLHAPVEINGVFGGRGLNVSDCILQGGTRGIQNTGTWVAYPVTIKDTWICYQGDVGIWFWSVCGCTISRVKIDAALRAAGEWYWSNVAVVGDTMHAVPGWPNPQRAGFIQHGSTCYYERQLFDYEYQPQPPFLLFEAAGDGLPAFARVVDCMTGGAGVEILPKPPGNVPAAGIVLTGLTEAERTVINPDGSRTVVGLATNSIDLAVE